MTFTFSLNEEIYLDSVNAFSPWRFILTINPTTKRYRVYEFRFNEANCYEINHIIETDTMKFAYKYYRAAERNHPKNN
jgi:hypothetical protein